MDPTFQGPGKDGAKCKDGSPGANGAPAVGTGLPGAVWLPVIAHAPTTNATAAMMNCEIGRTRPALPARGPARGANGHARRGIIA